MFKSRVQQQAAAYREITEQFVIDAAFLWVLRSVSVKQPHYHVEDIQELDKRIDANLDGAMSNFELAWEICLEELTYEQAGETFVAAVIAFRSRDLAKIKQIVDHGFINDDTFKGLVSALAWLPKELVNEWLQKFLFSKDLQHKQLALAVCSALRKKPGDVLKELFEREDCLAFTPLLVRTIRLVGELKLYAFANELHKQIDHEQPEVQFWANWALVMLGEQKQVLKLLPFINEDSAIQGLAVETVFKVLPIDKARTWISKFAQQPEMQRAVIRAVGILGDPHAVPWLIEKMNHFETAKIAAEAFTLITGIDLQEAELTIDPPKEIQQVPNDQSDDESVELDEDENLPFPYVSKINHAWLRYRDRYRVGVRYIMGIEVTENSPAIVAKLKNMLRQAGQRQRASLALTLTLLDAQSPYINVKARGVA